MSKTNIYVSAVCDLEVMKRALNLLFQNVKKLVYVDVSSF